MRDKSSTSALMKKQLKKKLSNTCQIILKHYIDEKSQMHNYGPLFLGKTPGIRGEMAFITEEHVMG